MENYVNKEKIVYLGWKTLDKFIYTSRKTYEDYLFVMGQSQL